MHVTMPYSMVEPIREQLDAGVQSDRSDIDERWTMSLQEEMKTAKVGVSCDLFDKQIKLRDVLAFDEGDIIPIDLPERVTLMVEDVPVFRGIVGVSKGFSAVKLAERVIKE